MDGEREKFWKWLYENLDPNTADKVAAALQKTVFASDSASLPAQPSDVVDDIIAELVGESCDSGNWGDGYKTGVKAIDLQTAKRIVKSHLPKAALTTQQAQNDDDEIKRLREVVAKLHAEIDSINEIRFHNLNELIELRKQQAQSVQKLVEAARNIVSVYRALPLTAHHIKELADALAPFTANKE